MSSPLLRIRDLHFTYDREPVIRGVDLDVFANEVLVIIGPSGCGKSTLLRLIAGLEKADSGTIALPKDRLSGPGRHVPPEGRPVGMVFQGLALFPHLTVAGNVGFGLAHLNKAERARRIEEELTSVGLSGLGDRYPHELSGGQQQRVAIARSLVRRPKVMLMDEPFSDLDAHTRANVRQEVLQILRAHGTAAIIVSHDREDAYHLADRIAEMELGRVVRVEDATTKREAWRNDPFAP